MLCKEVRKTLGKSFPVYVEGIGYFKKLNDFMRYCNASRGVIQKAFNDYPDNWVEMMVSKDTGPYYVDGVETLTKREVASKLGFTPKSLAEKVASNSYISTQDYIDFLEETSVKYEGELIYSAAQLAKKIGFNVKSCSGMLRKARALDKPEDRESLLMKTIQNRIELKQIINAIDSSANSLDEFLCKYPLNRITLIRLSEIDKPIEYKIQRLRKLITK